MRSVIVIFFVVLGSTGGTFAQRLFVIEKEGFTRPRQRQLYGPGDYIRLRLVDERVWYEQPIVEVHEHYLEFADQAIVPLAEIAAVRVDNRALHGYWLVITGEALPVAGIGMVTLFALQGGIGPTVVVVSAVMIGGGLLARSYRQKTYRPGRKWQFITKEADGFRYRQFLRPADGF